MKENDFLHWIQDNTPAHPAVPTGIGDDMAVVSLHRTPNTALLKIDQCLDRVHFDLREHTALQAGTKAVNRCLSDCAGMACLPAALLLSVALPRDGEGSGEPFAKELYLACQAAAAQFDCPLVGGDTALWNGPLAITVAALGELPPGRTPVLRSGARPGDTLFVSGALGGSILGRHLAFTPRIDLAQKLLNALGKNLHAMMDLSDGLAQDLPRLCTASNVGAHVHTARLPIHADAHRLSMKDRIPPGLHALADGEDYELLFAVDPDAVPDLIPLSETGGVPLTAIGLFTEDKALALVDEQGNTHPWPRMGWQHQSA